MSRAQITLAASDTTAGAFASVKSNLDSLGRDAQLITSRFQGVAASITSLLGGISIGAMVRSVAQGVDQLNDLKDATGASIGNLSALEDIAARTGTSMETVGTALVKFNAALSGAKQGTDAAEVFRRLGLSVADLKKQDPAEAFRLTAVALSRFADDGSKARAVQELFGKSLREVAPLLADVAKATELVGKVTEEQAAQAEKFNQQLDALAKNSLDAKRALLGELLPSLNKVLAAYTLLQGSKDISLATVFAEVAKGNTFANAADGVAFYSTKLSELRTQFKLLADGSSNIAKRGALIDLSKDIEATEKLQRYYQKLNELTAGYEKQTQDAIGGGRGTVNPPSAVPTPSIGDIGSQNKKLEEYLQKLREALLATQDISREEQARIDINRGLLGVLSEAQKAQVLGLAGAADLFKRLKDSGQAYNAFLEEGRRLTEGLRTEQERVNDQLDRTQVLTQAGAVSLETNFRAIDKAFQEGVRHVTTLLEQGAKATDAVIKPVKNLLDESKELARSLNDALGESLLAAFEGNTARIGDIWKNLIKRMAAQALQAQLTSALFGDGYGVTTNQMGGAFGGVVDWFKSLGGGARAGGGPVVAGRPYLVGERGPEVIVPGSSGSVVPNSALAAQAGPTYQIVVQGDASENTLRLINGALAQFQARQMRGAM